MALWSRRLLCPVRVVLLGPLAATAAWPPGEKGKPPPRILRIAGYHYELPAWWDSVTVAVPEGLKDEDQIRAHVKKEFGADTGTKKTWQEALKVWAIASQRLDRFPVYLAHCHKAGEDHKRAAKIYADLYPLADKQGKNKY